MIVLDASVLIAHLEGGDAHHDRAGAVLTGLGDEPVAASAITLAEVLVGPARAGKLDLAIGALGRLEVGTVGLDRDAPSRLAMLRAGTGLKLPDCCVLLAAEQTHSGIATFDDRLARSARGRGITVRDR